MDETKNFSIILTAQTQGIQKSIQEVKAYEAAIQKTASNLNKTVLGPTGKPATNAYEQALIQQSAYKKSQAMFPYMPIAKESYINESASPRIIIPSGYNAGTSQLQRSVPEAYNPQQLQLPNYSQKPLQLPDYSNQGFQMFDKGGALALAPQKLQEVTLAVKGTTAAMKDMSNAQDPVNEKTKGLDINLGKLVGRALITIPVWMALRAVFQGIVAVTKSVIDTYTQLDVGMAKVMAVASYTADTQAKTYAGLEHAALQYYTTTSRSMTEITDAMYQLGTAGRSTEEIMKGFSHVMNLAIGTYNSTTVAGKTVAGVLNVFEKQLASLGGTEQKIQYITDVLSSAWKNNQIELNELAGAMEYLGGIGTTLNLKFEELVAFSSVMSDALLRGGKGGRELARAFVELGKETVKIRSLGVLIDPNKPLNVVDAMRQLKVIYDQSGHSIEFVSNVMDTFGTIGGRAVLNVLNQWEKFQIELNRTPDQIKGTAEELKKLAEGSWGSLIQKAWRNAFVGGGTGTGTSAAKENFVKAVIAPGEQDRKNYDQIAKVVELLGDKLKLTKDQALDLLDVLKMNADDKLFTDLSKLAGLNFWNFLAHSKDDTGGKKVLEELISRWKILSLTAEEYRKAVEKPTKPSISSGESMFRAYRAEGADYSDVQKAENAVASIELMVKAGDDLNKLSEERIKGLATSLGYGSEDLNVQRDIINYISQRYEKETEVNNKLLEREKLDFKQLQDAVSLANLQNQDLKESEVIKAGLVQSINRYNEGLKGTTEYTKLTEEEQEKWKINLSDIEQFSLGALENQKENHKSVKDMMVFYEQYKNFLIAQNKETAPISNKQTTDLSNARILALADAKGIATKRELLELDLQLIKNNDTYASDSQKRIDIYNKETEILAERNAELRLYTDPLKESLQGSIGNAMSGQGNVGDIFSGMRDTMAQGYQDTVSEGFTNILMGAGLGDSYAKSMDGLRQAFGIVKQGIEGKIEISNVHLANIVNLLSGRTTSDGASISSANGIGSSIPLAGVAGGGGLLNNLLSSGVNAWYGVPSSNAPNIPDPTRNTSQSSSGGLVGNTGYSAAQMLRQKAQATTQNVGMGVQGILTGYSAYQSAKAGGASTAGSVMGGLGGIGLGIGGSMLGGAMAAGVAMGPVGWVILAIGALLTIGSMFMKGSKSTQSSSQSQTSEQKVSSKIDITNKQLEVVNRNLVALKNAITTYVLPSSAYFAEKMGLDEQFAVNAKRGLL